MIEFPQHIRLVASNSEKRTSEIDKPSQSRASQGAKGSETSDISTGNQPLSHDVVNLVSLENRKASRSGDRPTLEEAEQALRELQEDLGNITQDVGEIHSNLDRRMILGLLAPLVTS